MVDTRQNLLTAMQEQERDDYMKSDEHRKMMRDSLGQYSTSELLTELERRKAIDKDKDIIEYDDCPGEYDATEGHVDDIEDRNDDSAKSEVIYDDDLPGYCDMSGATEGHSDPFNYPGEIS